MPGPNDFHFDATGQMMPGLGTLDPRKDTPAFVDPPRDGRTREAKLKKMAETIDAERAALERDRAEFEAKKKAGG